MHRSRTIEEIDISQMIREKGDDIIINLNTTLAEGGMSNEVLIRNGIVILLCKADGGSICVDSKEYKLSKNNIVVLPENHIINNISPSLMRESNIIAVSVDYILNMPSPIDTSIFSYSRYMSVIKIADEKFDDLQSYYRFIYKESRENGKYRVEIIRSIFFALILEILAEYEKLFEVGDETSDIKANNLSDRFFRLLATNYKKSRSVKFYAERLNLTPKYLSTAIKRVTGRPILDWIHEAILIDAKMLLRTTDMTVQEIADQLNFSSPSAFVQFFKKHTGKTPKGL
ncbi:MAG: AraC family transcriptional regulator [Bacteroidaceae bacterium]|nr:AraC family transcriptional regulator [Bacteroidaceae bacterium]MBQ8807627.1 AraC family transcriptional regulator [Bacteroidaceae bacterium]